MIAIMLKAVLVIFTLCNIILKIYEIFKTKATLSNEHKQFLIKKITRIFIDLIFIFLILLTT